MYIIIIYNITHLYNIYIYIYICELVYYIFNHADFKQLNDAFLNNIYRNSLPSSCRITVTMHAL